MTKGKLVLALLTALIIVGSVGVRADFSYNERYDSYTKQYDTWVYDVDIDDEDYRIILKHTWSSPRYSYEYETGSDFAFDYAPATPRYLSDPLQLTRPPTYSYNIGRTLTSAFSGYRPYSYHTNSWGGYSGYYKTYW